jgi:hypothetical protein
VSNKEDCIIAGMRCRLELGAWTMARLQALFQAGAKCQGANERISFMACALLGTPFCAESSLAIPPPGILRVRLETLDCITFVYTTIALAAAHDLNQFVRHLFALRYHDAESGRIDSDPEHGNIYDYVEESLLRKAIDHGYLVDITERVADPFSLVDATADLQPMRRKTDLDPANAVVTPKYGAGQFTASFIPQSAFSCLTAKVVRSGDILLMTRALVDKELPRRTRTGPLAGSFPDGTPPSYLIQHCSIAHIEKDDLYMIHATKQFAWRPDATADSPPSHTGMYLGNDPRKEQLGVSFSGQYVGDESIIDDNGIHYYGYNPEIKRSVRDFAIGCNFNGVKVLRPTL